MDSKLNERVRLVTSELYEDRLLDLDLDQQDITYKPLPDDKPKTGVPVWRVRFEPLVPPYTNIGIDINGEILLGRGEVDNPGFVGLDAYEAEKLGVSRQHVLLRPGENKLYVLDAGSTNGTWRNGRSIGVNTPYNLSNGDLLKLGKLELSVHIVKYPRQDACTLQGKAGTSEHLLPIVNDIAAQITLDEVLKQALQHTRSLAAVDEVSIWLVDEHTGDLFLEAEQGIQDEDIRRIRLSANDSLAGKVIATGKSVRASRTVNGPQVKVKTGYLVDAVIYVPLTLSGVTFGVLCAIHTDNGRSFTEDDENMMTAIANMTAIAIQNARLYESAERALIRHTKVMTALNYVLAYDVKKRLNAALGYTGLLDLSMQDNDCNAVTEQVDQITTTTQEVASIIERLHDITMLYDNFTFRCVSTDLVKIIGNVVADLEETSADRGVKLDYQLAGEPYLIYGDPLYLYHTVANLLENAIKYSPALNVVTIVLKYLPGDITIRVQDNGPGIHENDLPYLFDKYFRGNVDLGGKTPLGLGLELARATVHAHRGKITARNIPKHGAEFTIILPGALRIT